MEIEVGRIIRSSTTRFAVGCQVMRPQVPVFGSLVKVRTVGDEEVYGLIHDVRMEDDPFVRQMAATEGLPPEYIEDQRRNRQVPIEVSILVVGHRHEGTIYHRLPPQPPLSLDVIYTCTGPALVEFTQRFDYFHLVLDNRDLPADELLAANLRYAAAARGDGEDFLVAAGRELACLLVMDLQRLDAILRKIRP
jgi:hypothetical protein